MGILDRLRQKAERFENRVARMSAKVQSKVRTQRVDVINPQDEVVRMKSSWIRSFAYDNRTHSLFMTTHKGKTYEFYDVPQQVAWNCIRGNATCTTSDRKQRWWVGKNPSLGAAYWDYLVGNYGSKMHTRGHSGIVSAYHKNKENKKNNIKSLASEIRSEINNMPNYKVQTWEHIQHRDAMRKERAAKMRAAKKRVKI